MALLRSLDLMAWLAGVSAGVVTIAGVLGGDCTGEGCELVMLGKGGGGSMSFWTSGVVRLVCVAWW